MQRSLLLLVIAACGGQAPAPAAPSSTEVPAAPVAAPGTELDAAVCATRPDVHGPVRLDAAQAALRRGTGARRFTDIVTTKERPIEVCGVASQHGYLTRMTCADGSSAFADPTAVRTARRGSVGEGGLCGTIIDLYVVTCPEATYEVHLDMYLCGPDEAFM